MGKLLRPILCEAMRLISWDRIDRQKWPRVSKLCTQFWSQQLRRASQGAQKSLDDMCYYHAGGIAKAGVLSTAVALLRVEAPVTNGRQAEATLGVQ